MSELLPLLNHYRDVEDLLVSLRTANSTMIGYSDLAMNAKRSIESMEVVSSSRRWKEFHNRSNKALN